VVAVVAGIGVTSGLGFEGSVGCGGIDVAVAAGELRGGWGWVRAIKSDEVSFFRSPVEAAEAVPVDWMEAITP